MTDLDKNGKIGSSFDAFLAEEGILETCEEHALKEILGDLPEGTPSLEDKRAMFSALSDQVRSQIDKRRLSETEVVADFESWRKARAVRRRR